MEGSSFLKSARPKPGLAERIAMRRPAPLTAHTEQHDEPTVLRTARRLRDEWRKKRYAQFKA